MNHLIKLVRKQDPDLMQYRSLSGRNAIACFIIQTHHDLGKLFGQFPGHPLMSDPRSFLADMNLIEKYSRLAIGNDRKSDKAHDRGELICENLHRRLIELDIERSSIGSLRLPEEDKMYQRKRVRDASIRWQLDLEVLLLYFPFPRLPKSKGDFLEKARLD